MNNTPRTQCRTSDEIQSCLNELPMLPRVVVELSGLDPESEEFATTVRSVAESDPPLAVRIVVSANSAASAPIEEIVSIDVAVNRLGARRVANIVTSLAVMRVFIPSSEGQKNLWRHSVQVAVAAREIAAASGHEDDASKAYLLGLLHDIGRFVMFEHDPVDLESVDARNWTTPAELLAAEESLCGFNHADLGAMACRAWELPKEISMVIAAHHRSAKLESPALDVLVRVIQLADRISCEMLQDPMFAMLSEEGQGLVIAGLCDPIDDNKVPVDATTLLRLMPTIRESSIEHIAGLGL